MRTLSEFGIASLLAAAGGHVVAVRLRSEGAAGWRDWWAGAWAPLSEFDPKGRYWAVGARLLTGLGLLLYLLGQHPSVASQ
jgi:hypothetical protein